MERVRNGQAATGLALAAGVITGWLAVHVATVFWWRWDGLSLALAPAVIAISCWLYVGLFIVAHDCMHGSLVPGWPVLNRWIGRLCLLLYAGFDYDTIVPKHMAHHSHPGSRDDPDFDDIEPQRFWRWFARFFQEYFGARQAAVILAVSALYLGPLEASLANVMAFWALPALLSALQLFTFGTYLPHRHGEPGFTDHHNARSNDYPAWLSLLTCYHFGYHHAHHLAPHLPWWRLPAAHRDRGASKDRRADAAP